MNCGSYFIMEPGIVKKADGNYIKWKCAGCGRTDEWPAPYDMQPRPERSSDIMEE